MTTEPDHYDLRVTTSDTAPAIPCQGRQHAAGTLGHRPGPATWRIATFCTFCGDRTAIHLCAGRVEFVQRNRLPMECDRCGASVLRATFWQTMTALEPHTLRVKARRSTVPEPTAEPAVPVPSPQVDLVSAFVIELRSRASTPKTIAVMTSTLRTFAAWLPVPLVDAGRDQIVDWLATEGWAPLTRRTYKTTLNSFYEWLTEAGWITYNPVRRIRSVRIPYSEPDPLTTEQIQQLLDSGIRRRTRLMVLLAAYQGMRVSEIASCHLGDLDLGAGTIRIAGKGGTDLRRPLHPLVAETITTMQPTGYLFPGNGGREHVTGASVSSSLSAAMRRAGIHGHRPHQLRAWHATELVRLGVDTVTVQHSMRHASLAALHKYVHPDAADIAGAMRQLPRVEL